MSPCLNRVYETNTGHELFLPSRRRPDDGVPVERAVRLPRRRGISEACRAPGAQIMKEFFEVADREGFCSFFYGDTDHTLAKLRVSPQEDYPGHRTVGTYSPPFRPLTAEED